MSDLPIVLLLLLAVAFLLRMDFVFYLVYVMAGAYALARWWTARSLPHLRVSRRFTDHIFVGEHARVTVAVQNLSRWPVPWLLFDETPPPNLGLSEAIRHVVTLQPRGRADFDYELRGDQRGYYQIGPGLVRLGDLFGFAETGGLFEESRHLTVYPRVIPLAHGELSSRSPHGTIKSRQHIFADPARVSGIRAYQSGDPLRSIDWKSSARVGNLQVKKYDPAVSLNTVIFLDLHSGAYSRHVRYSASEWGVVVAASLANYLISQRQPVGLACNGVDPLTGARCWMIDPRPGRVHLMKLLEWLARVQLAETIPLNDWLPTATVGMAWGTTLIAVTPSGDEATCAALHRLRRAGLNPVLMAVEAHGQFGAVRERAGRLGIPAYQVPDERGLEHWAAGQPGSAPR